MRTETRWIVPGLMLALLGTLPAAAEQKEACPQEAIMCVKYMIENLEGKGWLGIELEYAEGDASPAGRVMTISRVIEDSPAEAAGFRVGDLFVAVNGARYASATDEALAEAKRALMPGNRVAVTLGRDGSEILVDVVAGKVPDTVLAQWIGNHILYQHRHQIAALGQD